MAFTVVVSAVGSSVGGLFMLAVGSFSLTGAGVDPWEAGGYSCAG